MKKCIKIIFLILLLTLSSCNQKSKEINKKNNEYNDILSSFTNINKKYIIVKEGIGFNNIVLMKTNKSEMIISHGDNFEMNYKNQGITFYFDSNGKNQRIEFISFDRTFFGKTLKGFEIQSMTLNDVFRIYGNPDWRFSNERDEIDFDYKDLGICFTMKKKVQIPDSIPNSYSILDIYVNRKILNYFKNEYGHDKIKEFTITTPKTINSERPFLGKSKVDTVFEIKVSKKPVSLLGNRLTANFPEGLRVDDKDSYIEFDKNKQTFGILVVDYNCLASNDMKADINEIIKSWGNNNDGYKLNEIITKKDIVLYVIEPLKFKLVEERFWLKSVFVKNADNTIMYLSFDINTYGWYNIRNYLNLSTKIIKSLKSGGKRLNTKSESVQISTQKRKIEIKKPQGLIYTKNIGPDFRVFRFEKLTYFNKPQSSMLIYIGNHPSFLYNQKNEPVFIEKKYGLLFGQKVEWNFCYKDKKTKLPYTIEGICEFDKKDEVHVALKISSAEDSELFKKSLPGTEY